MIRRVLALCSVAVVSVAACSSGSGKNAVPITATEGSCKVGERALNAGKTTFKVENAGSKVTEVYVYGQGDKIVGEVENIGPGATRTFSIDVKEGDYEVACKPGMTGSGIRTAIHVTGAGGAHGAQSVKASRAVEVDAVDFSFELADPKAKVGEAIEFYLNNKGTHPHEFEVIDPDGKPVGEVGEVKPGENGGAVIEFKTAGTYRYECHIEDHFARGMKGEFAVG